MAIRASTISQLYTSSAAAQTAVVPANQVGDIMMLNVFYGNPNRTVTFPSGFTALTATTGITSRGITYRAWKRITGSADSGTYSLTPSGTTTQQFAVVSVSGRDTSATPFSFNTQNSAGATATVPPTLTGTAATGDDLLYFLDDYNGTAGMTVSGFTLVQEDTATGVHLYAQENTTAGSKSVVSSSTASNSFWVHLDALKAAPVAPADIPDVVTASYGRF